MKRVHTILSRTAVALVVAIGSTTPTLAAVCENVTFSFTNRSEGPIQVTGVGYRDLNSGDPTAGASRTSRTCPAPAATPARRTGMISARSPGRVRITI